MGSYNVLEPILKDILGMLNPLREDWETRMKVISDLREVVESVESLRGNCVFHVCVYLLYNVQRI